MEDKELTPFQRVALPLKDEEIEWRVQTCGKSDKGIWAKLVPYIQSRAVMNRFDEVFGPQNWRDEYVPITLGEHHGFLCQLSVCVDDVWIAKSDAAPITGIESIKGGISDALKRTAVKFGMGRELYTVGEVWAYNPIEGYPPRNEKNAVVISSNKDGGIRAWCRPPAIAIVLAQPEPPEPKKEKPKVVTQTMIEKIQRLEKTAHSSVPEMDNSRENHKVSDKIEQTPYDVLYAYGVHLKAKIESKNA